MMECLMMFDAEVTVMGGVVYMVEVGLLKLGYKVLPRLEVKMLSRLRLEMVSLVWFPWMVS